MTGESLAAKRLLESLPQDGKGWMLPTLEDRLPSIPQKVVWKPIIVRFLHLAIDRACQSIKAQGPGTEGDSRKLVRSKSTLARSTLALQALQSARSVVQNSSNLPEVCGLVSSHTFAINTARLGNLLDVHIPVGVRKVLLRGILQAMQLCWDRIYELLMARCKCFHRAFQWLDADGSGYMKTDEFVRAFTELKMSNMTLSVPEEREKEAQVMPKDLLLTALRADAEFLFQALQTEQSGLPLSECRNVQVTKPHLIMRIMSVSGRSLQKIRNGVLDRWPDYLHSAVEEFGVQKRGELNWAEFKSLCQALARVRGRGAGSARQGEQFTPKDRLPQLFQGADLWGRGSVSVQELERVLGQAVPTVPFSTLRKRLLLRHGSFEPFFAKFPSGFQTEDEVTQFSHTYDLNPVRQGWPFARDMGLLSRALQGDMKHQIRDGKESRHAVRKVVSHARMPEEGYSVEEFAIAVFLCKQEKASPEDLARELSKVERERHVSFHDFSEHIVSTNQKSYAMMRKASTESPFRRTRDAGKMNRKDLAMQMMRSRKSRPTVIHVTPSLCSKAQLRIVYEALEREHKRVSVDAVLRSMRNVSDCIALDKCTYQAGERIACRIRLSSDLQKQCSLYPFLAVVPRHLETMEDNIGRTFWVLDGRQVTKFSEFSESYQQLPVSPHGHGVLPEASMWITAPFVSSNIVSYEVRIFASRRADGSEALKQVGQAVPIEVLLPRPQPPHVEMAALQNEDEGFAELHWSAPQGSLENHPIVGFILQVEPVVFRREIPVNLHWDIDGCNDDFSDSEVSERAVDEDDDGTPKDAAEDNAALKEVVVWSPNVFDFSKRLKTRVDGLKRGMEYRFGVQCLHACPLVDGPQLDPFASCAEVRGAPSELSGAVSMPLAMVLQQPGRLRGEWSKGMDALRLRWQLVFNENIGDHVKICRHKLEYRHVHSQASASEDGSDSDETNDGEEDQNHHAADEQNHADWQPIDEASSPVFTTAPIEDTYGCYEVCCTVEDVAKLRGVYPGQRYQFRVCVVNLAGESEWSWPSPPIKANIGTNKPRSIARALVSRLEVIESQGTYTPLRGLQSRTQCHLRWRVSKEMADSSPKYMFQVTDLGDTAWYWTKVQGYILHEQSRNKSQRMTAAYSQDFVQVEALVTGLEVFPPNARLSLQMVASTDRGSCTAEVEVPPTDREPAAPPNPPEVVQALLQEDHKVMVEIQWNWRDANSKSEEPTLPTSYAVQAAHCLKGHAGDDRHWSAFSTLSSGVHMSSVGYVEGPVSCILKGLEPGSVLRFRVCALAPDGRLGAPSTASAPVNLDESLLRGALATSQGRQLTPGDLGRRTSSRSRNASTEGTALDASQIRRPRDLQIQVVGESWCEITFELRMPMGHIVSSDFEVQECRREEGAQGEQAAVENWQFVRTVYTTLGEKQPVTDEEDGQQVRVAVFFHEEMAKECSTSGGPCWRLRVRPVGGLEWSVPSHWQRPASVAPPQQPGTPELVRSALQYHSIEWTEAPGDEASKRGAKQPASAAVPAPYELQAQVHARRGWVASAWFTAPLSLVQGEDPPVDTGPTRRVRALVERTVIADALAKAVARGTDTEQKRIASKHGSALSAGGADMIRFRVRVAADAAVGSMDGLPSEWSKATPNAVASAPVPAPERLRVAGLGRLFMEDLGGEAREPELLQLEWDVPEAGPDSGGLGAEHALEPVAYEVEREEQEDGAWLRLPGVLVHVDQGARRASALVMLPGGDGVQQARFRVVALRAGMGGQGEQSAAACSGETEVLRWGRPLFEAGEAAPLLEWAEPALLSLRFTLGSGLTASVKCAVWAVLEVSSSRMTPSSHFTRSPSDDGGEPTFERIGEYPVFWNPGSNTDQGYAKGDCRGVVVLPSEARRSPGERVRVRLRTAPFEFDDEDEVLQHSAYSADAEVLQPMAGGVMARRLSAVSWRRPSSRCSLPSALEDDAPPPLDNSLETMFEAGDPDQEPSPAVSPHGQEALLAAAVALDGPAAEQAARVLRRPSLLRLCARLCALSESGDEGLALEGARKLLGLSEDALALAAEASEAELEAILGRGSAGSEHSSDSDGEESWVDELLLEEPAGQAAHASQSRRGSRVLERAPSEASEAPDSRGGDVLASGLAEPPQAPSRCSTPQDTAPADPGGGRRPSVGAAGARRRRSSLRGGLGPQINAFPNLVQAALSYPGVPLLWPAFVELAFTPVLSFCSPSRRRSSGAGLDAQTSRRTSSGGMRRMSRAQSEALLELVRFSVDPPLPRGVSLDTVSGTISGTPMLANVAEATYVVTASWEATGDQAALCALRLGVGPADLDAVRLAGSTSAYAPARGSQGGGGGRPLQWETVDRATQTPGMPGLPTASTRPPDEQHRRRPQAAPGRGWPSEEASTLDWPALRSYCTGPWTASGPRQPRRSPRVTSRGVASPPFTRSAVRPLGAPLKERDKSADLYGTHVHLEHLAQPVDGKPDAERGGFYPHADFERTLPLGRRDAPARAPLSART